MRRIRIAQIGTSAYSHGNDIFSTLKKLPDLFDIAGVCFPEGERERFPERMPAFEGYPVLTLDEILRDDTIEAVTVETEEKYLTKYALLCAEHGKHIHMEKPGGTSFADFEGLIKAVKSAKKVFHIGYMYRYNPEIVKLKKSIADGELGEIVSVEAQMNCLHNKTVRAWLGEFEGGVMFFLGCHLIDLISGLQGMPQNIIPINCSSGIDGVCSKDFGMAVLKYPHGVSFAKVSTLEVGGFMRRQLVVSGTKKTVEIKPLEFWHPEGFEHGMYSTIIEYEKKDWSYKPMVHDTDYYDRYEDMMKAFAQMVRGERKNPYTPDYEFEIYKTVLECCGIKL